MKKFLLSGVLMLGALSQVTARTWTDVKGRKIDAEFVSQDANAVTLKLKNGNEVKVPFSNLSRGDLAHLVELDTASGKKERPAGDEKMEKEGEGDEKAPAPVADADWDKAVPKEAVLMAPIEVQEVKKDKLTHYSSANFRIVADSRLKSKALQTILEACELTRNYCEALPFGLESRFEPIDGKYEIHTIAKKEDWAKTGGPEEAGATFNPATGQLNLCLEILGLSESGRGSDDRMRSVAGHTIRHVTSCMRPEVYERNFMDWFKEGLPNLINCAVYDKSRLDFTKIVDETKDLLLGKGGSGQKPLFKKVIEMPQMSDLLITKAGGVADEEDRRKFLGQSVLVMAYLVYMEDGGKATGLRSGLRYAYDFQKNFPKTIPAASQEEFEEKKAALMKQRDELGEKATAMIFKERPWAEVEADITRFWKEQGLKLVFPGAKEEDEE
ncbi:MAG: hypothetical protein ACI8UZ_002678 [Akkermansiaceae bacterium]|jgi:hypothetical protein